MKNNEEIHRDIKNFFNNAAGQRDREFLEDPVLGYEQEVRQGIIFDLINPKNGDRILEVGCGNGRDTPFYLSFDNIRYFGLDISKDMIENARKKIMKIDNKNYTNFLLADAKYIPFPDNSFDWIVCSEVLEHIPGWENVIKELARIIKNNGVLIITTPNKFSIYGLTRLFYSRMKGTSHPYDSWKNYWLLKQSLQKNRFLIDAVRGACYLPGFFSYMGQVERLLIPILPNMKIIENRFLAKNWVTRYFGYMIAIRCKYTFIRSF